ncbi:Stealth CR1 domain-containing protein [Nitratifractor sp.]|uniref:Stealth CR1 domain-containing protein n=1 Tax=Nitratifractor sp. TaxID=2268144 RepID=UPI0025D090C3|nr:Stealth CR1 domain-containing protein [Nitratifractor sp.]
MIDVVILWVDGSDPTWRQERSRYAEKRSDTAEIRFRDWGTLRYLFRGLERFAPWVRRIHLVTWGHVPPWLRQNHPRLRLVRHEEYIDPKFLPLFNANALEINLHRIEGLAEHFIYFNDDLFFTAPTEPTRFFLNGKPRDSFVTNALSSSQGVGHFVLNDLEIINRYFDKWSIFRRRLFHCFNLQYGAGNLRTMALLPWRRFTGFVDYHLPQPFCKSTFDEVWSLENEALERTSASRFRRCDDLNQYLFRYWHLAKGEFVPVGMHDGKYVTLSMRMLRDGTVDRLINSGKYRMICVNDDASIFPEEFAEAKELLRQSFEKLLPEKSEFEL